MGQNIHWNLQGEDLLPKQRKGEQVLLPVRMIATLDEAYNPNISLPRLKIHFRAVCKSRNFPIDELGENKRMTFD